MKYRNASAVFPDRLLHEMQKYAAGELIYIPKENEHDAWGTKSGAKAYYATRNDEIRAKYRSGKTIQSLTDEYSLSVETIRRILYK